MRHKPQACLCNKPMPSHFPNETTHRNPTLNDTPLKFFERKQRKRGAFINFRSHTFRLKVKVEYPETVTLLLASLTWHFEVSLVHKSPFFCQSSLFTLPLLSTNAHFRSCAKKTTIHHHHIHLYVKRSKINPLTLHTLAGLQNLLKKPLSATDVVT